MQRGKIVHRERAAQIRDFSGLRFGNITPTDLDGLIEWRDRAFVLMEVKHTDAVLPFGQRLALERMCDALHQAKPTLLIVASHCQPIGRDIDMATCDVVEYRSRGQWRAPKKPVLVRALVEQFLELFS